MENTGLVFHLIVLVWVGGWRPLACMVAYMELQHDICLYCMHALKVFGWMEGYASNILEVLYGLGIGGIWDMPIGFTAQQGDR